MRAEAVWITPGTSSCVNRRRVPSTGFTVAIAALPLLMYLLFHRRAKRAAPKLRAWMNANSWLVKHLRLPLFIVLLVG